MRTWDQPVVQARQISVRVGGLELLRNVNLTINACETVALVGHNGAGKSTLLRAMCGQTELATGELLVHGASLGQIDKPEGLRKLRSKVSLVHQGLHLVGRLSALHNVLIGGAARYSSALSWLRQWPASEITAARSALERVGLDWAVERRTDSLSGGERQKVAVARALHQRAPLMLADEPTASLDVAASAEIAALLATAAAEANAALVSVVHDLSLVPVLARRVVVLEHGAVIADWPVNNSTPERLRGLIT